MHVSEEFHELFNALCSPAQCLVFWLVRAFILDKKEWLKDRTSYIRLHHTGGNCQVSRSMFQASSSLKGASSESGCAVLHHFTMVTSVA